MVDYDKTSKSGLVYRDDPNEEELGFEGYQTIGYPLAAFTRNKVNKPIKVMKNWSTTGDWNSYTAPELRRLKLHGDVARDDGSIRPVITSSVIDAVTTEAGLRLIETRNTVYSLVGPPNPEWVEWMKENGIEFDEEDPIRVL